MIRIKTTNGRPHTSALIVVIIINIILLLMMLSGISAILNISILKAIGLLVLVGFAVSDIDSILELSTDLIKNLLGRPEEKEKNSQNGETDQDDDK